MATGFDFTSLTAKPADVPAPKGGGGRKAMDPKDNPFVPMLVQSKDKDTGLQVEIPKSQVGSAKSLCRRAAEHLNLGVRIVIQPEENSDKYKSLGENAKVKMLFKWKVKTERKRRNKTETQETVNGGSAPTAPVSSTKKA